MVDEARTRRILALRAEGYTWQAIGDLLGISRQRAWQLGRAEEIRQRREQRERGEGAGGELGS